MSSSKQVLNGGKHINYAVRLHQKKWRDCQICPLGAKATTHVLWRGTIPCDVLLVGESPGASEDALGYPFIGPAGKVFDRLLADTQDKVKIGFTWAVTNILACWPHYEEDVKQITRVPSKEEAQACSPRLREFIDLANPKIILLLGQTAKKYFPMSDASDRPDESVLHVPHPSWLRRQGALDMSHVEYKRVVMTMAKFLNERLAS